VQACRGSRARARRADVARSPASICGRSAVSTSTSARTRGGERSASAIADQAAHEWPTSTTGFATLARERAIEAIRRAGERERDRHVGDAVSRQLHERHAMVVREVARHRYPSPGAEPRPCTSTIVEPPTKHAEQHRSARARAHERAPARARSKAGEDRESGGMAVGPR